MKLGRAAALLLVSLLAGCATVPNNRGLALAITLDDLPVHGELPTGDSPERMASGLLAALEAGGARDAHGFINGQQVEQQPAHAALLQSWRNRGFPLGNHGWSHKNFNQLSEAEFEAELLRNEPLLHPDDGRWFRYPFLQEGATPAKRAAGRAILAKHNYRIAAVTMDFSDWHWTGPYVRCRGASDQAAIAELERSYMEAARQSIGFYRGLSRQLHGRDIPYVLLLHGGAFTTRMMPRLLELYRTSGFRFVSLSDAQRDPVYATDKNPAQPAGPRGLEEAAAARNLPLPPRTDFAPALDRACT
ncbi:polysaccharide deacetylase family protein [uncultured Sphingomonas sp.]|uniref:polysaccharide deacetylase family protein n=1 Tax=uncultured Sphingomonas sp. TaxID=158754 RepID=UPI0025FCD8EE|nr:polysaccharide deacetylase family protein [uncultured Sphingomonas sp.]